MRLPCDGGAFYLNPKDDNAILRIDLFFVDNQMFGINPEPIHRVSRC